MIKIKLGLTFFLVAQCYILIDFDSAYQKLKIVENMKSLKIFIIPGIFLEDHIFPIMP